MKYQGTLFLILVIAVSCKDESNQITSSSTESLFLAFEGGAFNFRTISTIHDRNENRLFFYDSFLKKGIVYNYSTGKAVSRGNFLINQDGYADLGYSYFNGRPELYIPNDTKVEIFNMRDLETTLSINTGHLVAGVSVTGNVISVGYCDRSIETYDRNTGSPISNSELGHLCDKIESAFFQDTLRVIGFPNGVNAFILNNYNKSGKFIFGRSIDSSIIFNPLIRTCESAGYFITAEQGHTYSFSGKYIGRLPNRGKDYSFSNQGDVIYVLLASGNIQRFSYPSLNQIGETFIKEDDVQWAPERIFTDDQNLIRVYNLAKSSTNTAIHLRVTPLSSLGK